MRNARRHPALLLGAACGATTCTLDDMREKVGASTADVSAAALSVQLVSAEPRGASGGVSAANVASMIGAAGGAEIVAATVPGGRREVPTCNHSRQQSGARVTMLESVGGIASDLAGADAQAQAYERALTAFQRFWADPPAHDLRGPVDRTAPATRQHLGPAKSPQSTSSLTSRRAA